MPAALAIPLDLWGLPGSFGGTPSNTPNATCLFPSFPMRDPSVVAACVKWWRAWSCTAVCLARHVALAPLLWRTSDSDFSHLIRVPSRSRTPTPQFCDSTLSLRWNILRTGSSAMRASRSWSYLSFPPPKVHISCPGCCSLVVLVVLCIAAGGPVCQFPPPMMFPMVSPYPSVLGRSVSAS